MISEKRLPLLTVLILAMAVLAISFSAILVRYAEAPALIIAAYRLIFTTLIIAPPTLILKRAEFKSLTLKEFGLAVAGGLFLAGHFYSWIASLGMTSVAHSVLFVSMHPLFVIVASRVFFGEAISSRAVLGSLVALTGAIIISGGSFQAGEGTLPGDLLALTGAVMMTGYLMVGRSLRANYSTLPYTFMIYGIAAAALTVLALTTRTPLYPYSGFTFMLFVAMAIIPTIMGHSVFNWALKRFSATLISLLFLGEPVGASLLAWFILLEQPGPIFFPGAAMVLLGLALVVLSQRGAPKPSAPDQNLPE